MVDKSIKILVNFTENDYQPLKVIYVSRKGYFMKLLIVILILTFSIFSHAITLQEWSKLANHSKFELLQNEELDYSDVDLKEPLTKETKELINRITPYLLNNLSTEAIEQGVWAQESIFLISEPEVSYVSIHMISGKTVALTVDMYQNGGATFDGTEPPKKYYSSESEAQRFGLDINADVSWSSRSFLNFDSANISEIEFDVYNEGGFSWSGW